MLGLSLGARPPFVVGPPVSHHSNYGPHLPAPHYATHPYSHGHHSYVTPCFSPQFQLLTNFYGDYFKPGVLCSSLGFDPNAIGPGFIRGGASGSEASSDGAGPPVGGVPAGIVLKSYTDQSNDEAPGDARSGLCDKVPKVCQLLSKNEEKKSRSLQPAASSPSWLDSMRQNFNSLYSFVTRRSTSHPASPSPLFSLLSEPSFSQQMKEPLPTVFKHSAGVHNPSWGEGGAGGPWEPCPTGGCAGDSEGQQSVRHTGSSGFPIEALDGHPQYPGSPLGVPALGLSVCEESEGVAYPLVGLSALTGHPVRLLQQYPLITQPVFFRRCRPARTPLLSGRCEQQFLAVAFFVDEPSYEHGRGGGRISGTEHVDLKLALEGKLPDAVSATMTPLEASKIDERSQRKFSANQNLFKPNQIHQRSGNQTPVTPSKPSGGSADNPSTKTKTQQGMHVEDQPQENHGLGDAPSDEAGERFSLPFLNSLLYSGSDHQQQFAVPPPFGGGHHGYGVYPTYNIREQYRQDYVMVEAGCRVVIDLPHVRRDSESVKGGETPPARELGKQ